MSAAAIIRNICRPAHRRRGNPDRARLAGRSAFWPVLIAASLAASAGTGDNWRGIRIADEVRCAPYDRDDYRYRGSIEAKIIMDQTGRVYGPYTGRTFADRRQTDIEHIVAVSEAHDSGLCAASPETKRAFASDLLNLTLAAPAVNRCSGTGKCAKDAAEWLPPRNRCWFAARVTAVRQKYDLTIDAREAAALEDVLVGCESVEMIVDAVDAAARQAPLASRPTAGGDADNPLALWDDNGNGRITCKEARRHGIAPVYKSSPAYRYMRDGDGDGVVCE